MASGPQPNRALIIAVIVAVAVIAVIGVWVTNFRPGDPEPAFWRVDADAVDPASSELPIEVIEIECASAASADGRIVVDVDETAETITLDVQVRRRSGDQNCPGNPITPHVVRLDAPVGDREILGQTPGQRWCELTAIDGGVAAETCT